MLIERMHHSTAVVYLHTAACKLIPALYFPDLPVALGDLVIGSFAAH